MKKDNIQEQEIDIIHMLLSVASHWRSLIVVLVIGLILGAVFSMTKMPAVTRYSDTNEIVPADTSSSLSTEEICNIELAANYYSVYTNLKAYIEDSVIMNLDFDNACEGRLYFALNSDGRNDEASTLVASLFQDSEFYNNINAKAGTDIPNAYLREAIAYYRDINGASDSLSGIVNEYNTTIFEVVISFGDVETTDKILAVISELLEERFKYIQSKYPEFKYTNLGSYKIEMVKTTLSDKKTNYNNQLNTALSNYTKTVSTFTDAQKAALKRYIAGGSINGKKSDRETYTKKEFTVSVLVENALIFGIGFAFLLFVIFAIIYIFTDKIKSAEAVERMNDCKIVFVKSEKAYKGLDKCIKGAMERRAKCFSSMEYAVESMFITTKDKAVIVFADEAKEEGSKLYDGIKEKTDLVSLGQGTLAENVATLKKAAEDGNVWLVVKANKSHLATLANEMKIIEDNSLNLLGVVIV